MLKNENQESEPWVEDIGKAMVKSLDFISEVKEYLKVSYQGTSDIRCMLLSE